MNIAMMLAFLVASGVCAETKFIGADGSELRVVVCPFVSQAPEEKPAEKPKGTPVLERLRGLQPS